MSDRDISKLICDEKYDEAIKLAKEALKKSSDWESHWIYACLSMAYYEKRHYKRAYKYSLEAVIRAPKCPFSLWQYAGSCDTMGKTSIAIEIYRSLVKRGAKRIAFGECGEGVKWSEALVNDCRYRLGLCYLDLDQLKEAEKWLKIHQRMRKKGQKSIYSRKELNDALKKIEQAKSEGLKN